jgi:hypothetical protein
MGQSAGQLAEDLGAVLQALPPHRIRHYGLFANPRVATISPAPASCSQRHNMRSSVPMPKKVEHTNCCPCCGGRMIIIERFKRGATPHHQPTAQTVSIRIDTSRALQRCTSTNSPTRYVGRQPAPASLIPMSNSSGRLRSDRSALRKLRALRAGPKPLIRQTKCRIAKSLLQWLPRSGRPRRTESNRGACPRSCGYCSGFAATVLAKRQSSRLWKTQSALT